MQAPQPAGPQPLPGVNAIIAVGSGKGGVGKTTLAVNLALALSKLGHSVGLLDADVYGPNVPLMMGSSATPRILGENRIEPLERYGIKVISVGYINPGDRPLIWRGPMLHQMIREFLQRVEWGKLDYLVADLPPGTGDVAISLIQTVPLTGAIVVSTPSDVSLQDARKAIEMFRQVKVDLLGLVENMSHFICPHCHNEIDIFSKGGAERTAEQFGLAFLGRIELDPDIRREAHVAAPVVADGHDSAGKLVAHARVERRRADHDVVRRDRQRGGAGAGGGGRARPSFWCGQCGLPAGRRARTRPGGYGAIFLLPQGNPAQGGAVQRKARAPSGYGIQRPPAPPGGQNSSGSRHSHLLSRAHRLALVFNPRLPRRRVGDPRDVS